MANNLVSLLGGDPRQSLALQELRSIFRDGLDIELLAEILAKAHFVMRQLGLDPADTTAEEVYRALIVAVETEQWLSILEDTEFVLLEIDNEIISFNPIDVVDNYHYQLPLEKRQVSAAKKGLGWEITKRYSDRSQTTAPRVQSIAKQANWPTEEPIACRIVFDKPSILTIGDTASEALITLGESQTGIVGERNNRQLTIPLGAKISCNSSETQDAVGGAANASVAFAGLGVQPSLISWLGDDTVGRQTLSYLRGLGVDMSGVTVDKFMRSNYHYVLRHKAERTIIANYQRFDYIWRDPACRPDWIYLSMISGDSWDFHEGLLQYLERNKSVKLAFQPGASHLEWGADKLAGIYTRSDVVIMNVDEAMKTTGVDSRGPRRLARALSSLGPKIVVVTDGPRGAFASDGVTFYEMPSYPDPESPVDRTGAGDAFASTLVAELAKGKGLAEAMAKAPINSMSVVQQVGAQKGLLHSQDIDQLLAEAPENYQVKVSDIK